jgi:hypothetical protein
MVLLGVGVCPAGANVVDRWRAPDNAWKKEPFLIEKLPTVVKVTAGGVSGVWQTVRDG